MIKPGLTSKTYLLEWIYWTRNFLVGRDRHKCVLKKYKKYSQQIQGTILQTCLTTYYLKSYRHWAVQTCYASFLKGSSLVYCLLKSDISQAFVMIKLAFFAESCSADYNLRSQI